VTEGRGGAGEETQSLMVSIRSNHLNHAAAAAAAAAAARLGLHSRALETLEIARTDGHLMNTVDTLHS